MEIIARNLPTEATERQVKAIFRDRLEKVGIKTFHCHKPRGRLAVLTIVDVTKARQFLLCHGQTLEGQRGFATVRQKLYHLGKPVNCSAGKNKADHNLLSSLKEEESRRYAASQSQKPKIVPAAPAGSKQSGRCFNILELSCGQWDYLDNDLTFVPYFQDRRKGRMIFGPYSVFIKLGNQQVEIGYDTIQSFTIGSTSNPSITLSLVEAPKLYEDVPGETSLAGSLQHLTIQRSRSIVTRNRITALNKLHQVVVGSCLCYRFSLSNPSDASIVKALKRWSEIPDSISWSASVTIKLPFAAQMTRLNEALTGGAFGRLPFELKFQLQKLAQNGYLSPSQVVDLLPIISERCQKKDARIVIDSVRQLFGQLPWAGPNVEAWELSLTTLVEILGQNQGAIERGEVYSESLVEQYEHIASVHKVIVTPAGTYLHGPEPEVKNRVLRKYASYPSHFLSVSFLDEDGEPLRLDRVTSGKDVYHGRYKKVLEGFINIAGRPYEVGHL